MYQVKAGTLQLNPHVGQLNVLNSKARFIAAIAGTQSGKTVTGPHWLLQEMMRKGPGDYIVATPTYPLLNLKLLPEFRRIFEDILCLGSYHVQSRIFKISEFGKQQLFGNTGAGLTTSVFFGHAQDPESLESATAKAAWLDEAGQKKFRLGSYEAILRRLSVNLGRLLITTTPYFLGWLKSLIWDRQNENHIDCFNFKSTMNPTFPIVEYERARSELPTWKFDMFYNGLFTRPAGAIYDCFDDTRNIVKDFDIPNEWDRYVGLDFGGVNTAAVKVAMNPETKDMYIYDTYLEGGKSAKDHAIDISRDTIIKRAVGGAPSEDQWRREFRSGGLRVRDPKLKSVELGIDRVYAALKSGKLKVLESQELLISDFKTYSRKLDNEDTPTIDIEDKSKYHTLDAIRYIIGGYLYRQKSILTPDSSINLNVQP